MDGVGGVNRTTGGISATTMSLAKQVKNALEGIGKVTAKTNSGVMSASDLKNNILGYSVKVAVADLTENDIKSALQKMADYPENGGLTLTVNGKIHIIGQTTTISGEKTLPANEAPSNPVANLGAQEAQLELTPMGQRLMDILNLNPTAGKNIEAAETPTLSHTKGPFGLSKAQNDAIKNMGSGFGKDAEKIGNDIKNGMKALADGISEIPVGSILEPIGGFFTELGNRIDYFVSAHRNIGDDLPAGLKNFKKP